MYMSQRITRMIADAYFDVGGPPNSPPITALLIINSAKQIKDVMRKRITDSSRFPLGAW